MDKVLNLELLRNPINWVIVVLMVMLGSIAVHYLFAAARAADTVED